MFGQSIQPMMTKILKLWLLSPSHCRPKTEIKVCVIECITGLLDWVSRVKTEMNYCDTKVNSTRILLLTCLVQNTGAINKERSRNAFSLNILCLAALGAALPISR